MRRNTRACAHLCLRIRRLNYSLSSWKPQKESICLFLVAAVIFSPAQKGRPLIHWDSCKINQIEVSKCRHHCQSYGLKRVLNSRHCKKSIRNPDSKFKKIIGMPRILPKSVLANISALFLAELRSVSSISHSDIHWIGFLQAKKAASRLHCRKDIGPRQSEFRQRKSICGIGFLCRNNPNSWPLIAARCARKCNGANFAIAVEETPDTGSRSEMPGVILRFECNL